MAAKKKAKRVSTRAKKKSTPSKRAKLKRNKPKAQRGSAQGWKDLAERLGPRYPGNPITKLTYNERCERVVKWRGSVHECGQTAALFIDGKHYCRTHDPERDTKPEFYVWMSLLHKATREVLVRAVGISRETRLMLVVPRCERDGGLLPELLHKDELGKTIFKGEEAALKRGVQLAKVKIMQQERKQELRKQELSIFERRLAELRGEA